MNGGFLKNNITTDEDLFGFDVIDLVEAFSIANEASLFHVIV